MSLQSIFQKGWCLGCIGWEMIFFGYDVGIFFLVSFFEGDLLGQRSRVEIGLVFVGDGRGGRGWDRVLLVVVGEFELSGLFTFS